MCPQMHQMMMLEDIVAKRLHADKRGLTEFWLSPYLSARSRSQSKHLRNLRNLRAKRANGVICIQVVYKGWEVFSHADCADDADLPCGENDERMKNERGIGGRW